MVEARWLFFASRSLWQCYCVSFTAGKDYRQWENVTPIQARAMGSSDNRWLSWACAVALLILLCAVITIWAWSGILPEDRPLFSGYVVIETVADAAIVAVASSVIIRFARQAAKTEREQRRIQHLTDMAWLSGGLAHEIRNHLNGLGTYLSPFRKSAEKHDGDLLGRIEKLQHVVSDLDELVSDFLTLTAPHERQAGGDRSDRTCKRSGRFLVARLRAISRRSAGGCESRRASSERRPR